MNELVVLLERTRDLFPVDELGDLLRQLPKFLKVDVGTWQSANGKEINENSSIFHLTYRSTHLLEHPSLRKYKSLTSSEKNGITIRSRSSVAPADRHIAAFSVDR